MIDFKVKKDNFGIFVSAVLKFDKEDVSVWTYIIFGLANELKDWQRCLQDAIDDIEDYKNEGIIIPYIMKKKEKRKVENEYRVEQLKRYIEMFSPLW